MKEKISKVKMSQGQSWRENNRSSERQYFTNSKIKEQRTSIIKYSMI